MENYLTLLSKATSGFRRFIEFFWEEKFGKKYLTYSKLRKVKNQLKLSQVDQ